MAKNIIFDSGFWFALYNPRDQNHDYAELYSEFLTLHRILIPWPVLYETLNTYLMRRKEWLLLFTALLRRNNVELIHDEQYRDFCYQSTMSDPNHIRTISLVDCVIRAMLSDPNIKAHSLVTFNPRDFIDVCRKMDIEIHCQEDWL